MSLKQIQLSHVRNLTELSFEPNRCNLIIGQNGSGKTSLLEAVYLLFRGKSFRHFESKHLIQFEADALHVFAKLEDNQTLGVQKSKGESKLKLNSNTKVLQSELTKLVPVSLIDPSALELLDHGSSSRRKLLDWLCFHTNPGFHPLWLEYSRLLKQRNSFLKHNDSKPLNEFSKAELDSWSVPLAEKGAELTKLRMQGFVEWQQAFEALIGSFLPKYPLTLSCHYGFDLELGFETVLSERTHKDVEQALTRVGPHRLDVKVMLHKHEAANVLSRGEKKLLITALKLAQLVVLTRLNLGCVVLLDDLTAELDQGSIERLLTQLAASNSQLFMTSLEANLNQVVFELWAQEAAVFHMNQGVLSRFT